MKLPSLKVSLPLIFLCWCVAGVMTHGWVILAYPAMWAVVGAFFFGLHLLLRAPAAPQPSQTTVPASSPEKRAASLEQREEKTTSDHKISAPV